MKILNPLVCISLIALASPAFAQVKYVSEGTVDLNNMYDNMKQRKVNPSAYGIPAEIVHTYTLRTTITIDEGVTAPAQRTQVPDTVQCSGGGDSPGGDCWTDPAHTEVNLRIPAGKALYEVIDGKTGKVIASQEEKLAINLFSRIDAGGTENLAGTLDLRLERDKSEWGKRFDVPLLPSVSKKKFILWGGGFDAEYDRLQGGRIEVVRADADHYTLRTVRLDQANVAKTVTVQDPMFDVDYDHLGYYLYVRDTGNDSFYYPRVLKSLN